MPFDIEVFSSNLRAERARTGITQEELAKSAGCTTSAICRYEKGQRIPMMDTALSIAKALNCSVDYLCRDNRPK